MDWGYRNRLFIYVGGGVHLLSFLQQSLDDPDVAFPSRDVDAPSATLNHQTCKNNKMTKNPPLRPCSNC